MDASMIQSLKLNINMGCNTSRHARALHNHCPTANQQGISQRLTLDVQHVAIETVSFMLMIIVLTISCTHQLTAERQEKKQLRAKSVRHSEATSREQVGRPHTQAPCYTCAEKDSTHVR